MCVIVMHLYSLLRRIRDMFSVQSHKERVIVEPVTIEGSVLLPNIPSCLGYLSISDRKTSIPEECLVCKKMLECRYFSSVDTQA